MSKTKVILSTLIILTLTAFTPDPSDKNIDVTLTVSQWQKIVGAVSSSENISAKDANIIIQEIQTQASKQLADTTTKAPQKK